MSAFLTCSLIAKDSMDENVGPDLYGMDIVDERSGMTLTGIPPGEGHLTANAGYSNNWIVV